MKDRDLDAVTDCGNHLPQLAASDMNVIVLRRWSGRQERPWPQISHGRASTAPVAAVPEPAKALDATAIAFSFATAGNAEPRSRYRARPIERAAWPAAASTAGPRITAATCRLARSAVTGRIVISDRSALVAALATHARSAMRGERAALSGERFHRPSDELV